jgi:hypothetical protein
MIWLVHQSTSPLSIHDIDFPLVVSYEHSLREGQISEFHDDESAPSSMLFQVVLRIHHT